MKEKIIKYIETLESKANDSDRYFLERNEALLKIDKAIEYINNASYFDGSSMCANDLLEILGDKENE